MWNATQILHRVGFWLVRLDLYHEDIDEINLWSHITMVFYLHFCITAKPMSGRFAVSDDYYILSPDIFELRYTQYFFQEVNKADLVGPIWNSQNNFPANGDAPCIRPICLIQMVNLSSCQTDFHRNANNEAAFSRSIDSLFTNIKYFQSISNILCSFLDLFCVWFLHHTWFI